MQEEKTNDARVSRGGRTDIERLILELPADEKRAALSALEVVKDTIAEAALYEVLAARRRTEQRRRSDRETDKQRRRLVGARLPRETAERCKWEAEAEGLSLNAWVTEAIAHKLAARQAFQAYEKPNRLREILAQANEEIRCPLPFG